MRLSREDLKWGLKWGLYMAAAFSALAAFIKAVFGPFDDVGFGLLGIVLIYFMAGILAGLLAGLFRPSVNSYRRAALVGFLGALVVYGTAMVGLLPVLPELAPELVGLSDRARLIGLSLGVLFIAVITGPLFGVFCYHEFRGEEGARKESV